MLKERNPEPLAIVGFALGVFFGVALFFTFVAMTPHAPTNFVARSEALQDSRMPATELYRQAGRIAPSSAVGL